MSKNFTVVSFTLGSELIAEVEKSRDERAERTKNPAWSLSAEVRTLLVYGLAQIKIERAKR